MEKNVVFLRWMIEFPIRNRWELRPATRKRGTNVYWVSQRYEISKSGRVVRKALTEKDSSWGTLATGINRTSSYPCTEKKVAVQGAFAHSFTARLISLVPSTQTSRLDGTRGNEIRYEKSQTPPNARVPLLQPPRPLHLSNFIEGEEKREIASERKNRFFFHSTSYFPSQFFLSFSLSRVRSLLFCVSLSLYIHSKYTPHSFRFLPASAPFRQEVWLIRFHYFLFTNLMQIHIIQRP